jgi:hypothetical protein
LNVDVGIFNVDDGILNVDDGIFIIDVGIFNVDVGTMNDEYAKNDFCCRVLWFLTAFLKKQSLESNVTVKNPKTLCNFWVFCNVF